MKAHARKRLAQRVRLLRTNRGWSQEVLAELSGLNRSYIGAVERAEHNIGLDNIERIAGALETGVPELLDNTEPVEHRLPPSQGTPSPTVSRPVIVHRKIFLELLRQCGQTHRELVLVYLERCGVTVQD
ncbi:MAG TPA: XRE family transcriptional regulator [Gammaproteobacteria bacterium]|nr:XRE family transcriptional regulator [Gammaproteobacteria bacterium]